MINPSEIRLGNYIYNHRQWICPVTEIFSDRITVIAEHYGEETFKIDSLYPIIITTTILEQLGFRQDKHPIGKHNCTAYVYERPKEFRLEIDIYKDTTRIELNLDAEHSLYMNAECPYLHTLQNIIYDAKIDFPIKLKE